MTHQEQPEAASKPASEAERSPVLPTEQDQEYEAALERAYVEYVPDDSPLTKAKRRRITTRTIMAVLAGIAVLLTAGGIAGPQVVYAFEASRFTDIVEEVDASAGEAEELVVLAEAEKLLFTLRSNEVRDLPGRLTSLSASPSAALGGSFKAEVVEAADAITAALGETSMEKAQVRLAEKATQARESELPDPKSWFDVDGEAVGEFAAIESTPLPRVEAKGTVTLERVQEARERLHDTETMIASETAKVDERSVKNAELTDAVDKALAQVTEESTRAATATVEAVAAQIATQAADGTEIAPEVEALRLAAVDLESAAQVGRFAVNQAGEVIGIAPDAPLPEGSMVIPGGPSVRLAYLLPKLESYVAAFDAEAEVRRVAEAEALAAAELAAQQELLRQQQEQQQQQPPPGTTTDVVPVPVPEPEPTEEPEPEPEPTADPDTEA